MSQKLPCSECATLILRATAERTDGKCMPCHQGKRRQELCGPVDTSRRLDHISSRDSTPSLAARSLRERGFGEDHPVLKMIAKMEPGDKLRAYKKSSPYRGYVVLRDGEIVDGVLTAMGERFRQIRLKRELSEAIRRDQDTCGAEEADPNKQHAGGR